jgi:hypothetical protein
VFVVSSLTHPGAPHAALADLAGMVAKGWWPEEMLKQQEQEEW